MQEPAWFHCILSTYGSWLHGDPRGFRTRHHREHVEWDYKHRPPPDQYAKEFERSQRELKQPPVELSDEFRPLVGKYLLERLELLGAQVLCVAVPRQQVHLLMKLPPLDVREWLGLAKKHVSFQLKHHGWQGKLWALRSKIGRIRDRQHQLNAYHYILRHREEGAWVWSSVEESRARHEEKGQSEATHTERPSNAQGILSLGAPTDGNPWALASLDTIKDHNARAWDAMVAEQHRFTAPARESDFANPLATVDPLGWLEGSIRGKRLLCLAAGGGKHSALYAAAGAVVTVVDISPAMLALDRAVAGERGLQIAAVQTSMDDLSMFAENAFDVVIHPVSTCYLPDAPAIFRQVARIIAPGGLYISQHKSPTSLQTTVRPNAQGRYELAEPYYRAGALPMVEGSPHREMGTHEFLHRWEDLLGGLCRAGFSIEDVVEPVHAKADGSPGEFAHRSQFVAPYVRLKARRRGNALESASRLVLW